MLWKCSVPGCKTTRGSNIVYHRFPRRNQQAVQKWLKVIGREEWLASGEYSKQFVCDLHFSSQQKFHTNGRNRTNLLFNAIPDQELPHTGNTSTSFETEASQCSLPTHLNRLDGYNSTQTPDDENTNASFTNEPGLQTEDTSFRDNDQHRITVEDDNEDDVDVSFENELNRRYFWGERGVT